jgi:hypothetical protein
MKERQINGDENLITKNGLYRDGKFWVILLLFMLSTSQTVEAQDLRGKTNALIGRIQSDGVVRNSSNAQIGKIDANGAIRDRRNAQIGKIDSDGIIRDRSNAQIGKVDSNGVVRDRSNAQIGKIDADGVVRDRSNAQIGSAKGIKREWAAVVFFFDFLF